MIRFVAVVCMAAGLATMGNSALAQMPEMPKAQKEHEWLNQLVGEWDVTSEITMEPGKPPMQTSGTDTTRKIGDFWVVSELTGDMMGQTFHAMMTLGYNPDKKQYVGTWVDSMQSTMWQYNGEVDESGKKLVLKSEGPCPMQGGKIVKFEETIEVKSPNARSFTSKVDNEGEWMTIVKAEYKRK